MKLRRTLSKSGLAAAVLDIVCLAIESSLREVCAASVREIVTVANGCMPKLLLDRDGFGM